MNDLENLIKMIISTQQDFSKRTEENNKDKVHVTVSNDIEFYFEKGVLKFVHNIRR